jgi:hypothetical protein
MVYGSTLSNTASNTINALVFAGVISITDAEFITARRCELDYFESRQAHMEPKAWEAMMISADKCAVASFKERFGPEQGRKLFKIIDY